MQTSATIPPLWERLPTAFAYGLRPWPLVLGLLLAAVVLLAVVGGSAWTIAVAILAYAVMFKYAFAVLQLTSEGDLDPPPLNWAVLGQGYELPLKFYGILLLFVLVLVSVGGKFGPVAVLVLLAAAVLSLPAVTMVLAKTGSLLSAINPLLVISTIGRIGWVYLVLLIFTGLLSAGQTYVMDLVKSSANPHLVLFGFVLVQTYFTLVSFFMIGYVLLQSYEKLGHDAPEAFQPDAEQQRLERFHQFMADGKTDAAIAELESQLKETPRDLGLHRRMHNLLLAEQRADEMATHTRRAIPFLLAEGHADLAAQFYADSSRSSDNAGPRRAECYVDLAEALRMRGRSREAALLINQFNREFERDDPNKPALYLLVARVLSEDLNQDVQARRLLDVALQTFPEHPQRQDMLDYLQLLDRVA